MFLVFQIKETMLFWKKKKNEKWPFSITLFLYFTNKYGNIMSVQIRPSVLTNALIWILIWEGYRIFDSSGWKKDNID